MKKNTMKQLANRLVPRKYFVSQEMTQHNYKNDFVYRWLMYTSPMLMVYKNFLQTGEWNCNDLDKLQRSTDMQFMINFPTIVNKFIKKGNIEEVKFITITENGIINIILNGCNLHVILLLFYSIYKIPRLQSIVKDACIDYEYFMIICKDKFDGFNFHYLLRDVFSKELVEMSLLLASDYMTNEKKKIKKK